MLFLVFEADNERYCLEVSSIIEVIPMVIFKKIPHVPEYFAGLFNYRGTIVPVIDLSMLICRKPSKTLFSTRIVLVNYSGIDQNYHILGLLVERATETIFCNVEKFQSPGIEVDHAKYLGDVIFDDRGMIQRIRIEKLPPETIQGFDFDVLKENDDVVTL